MSEWYCEYCNCVVDPTEVTYQERHDTRSGGCGRLVGTIDEANQKEATRKAAQRGMDAAKAVSGGQLREAHRLAGMSSPEALESERAANAALTAENDRLRAENEKRDDHFMNATLRANIAALADENDALRAKLAAAEADAARLDKMQQIFIEGQEVHILMCSGGMIGGEPECDHDTHPHFEAFDWSWRCLPPRGETLRDVIDKAIEIDAARQQENAKS